METRPLFAQTYEQLVAQQVPNLFRLFLNPYVVQTCLCLERYVQTSWQADGPTTQSCQTFLANGFHEALSGAIKLARSSASATGKSTAGLIFDPSDRLGPFASASVHGQTVEFLPGLYVVRDIAALPADQPFGFVVYTGSAEEVAGEALPCDKFGSALVIRCVDRAALNRYRSRQGGRKGEPMPDIVVFDESFVNHDVPFGAFTARKELFDHWNAPGKSTFHSTTFQPNTISTLHFMRCLEQADPKFHADIAGELGAIVQENERLQAAYSRLYNPALARAIGLTGFAMSDVRAAGNYVVVRGRSIFDAVGGVACSVRGHNPPQYAEELAALDDVDCRAELGRRLCALTGLECLVPAVSGASAVENMLKLALVAQFPRRHVLALKSGFGGKTLLALTGTWNAAYKENIDPLYSHVSYIDPFAPDAIAQIDAVLATHSVAAVLMELVQGVGGVRRVPAAVVRHLAEGRARHGYLLLVDEVQTGVYRTGPFTVSSALGIVPDLLVIGKALSDMMFPFALTLYSEKVQRALDEAGSHLPESIRRDHDYTVGYQTALNVLRFADRTNLSAQVAAGGALFAQRLREELADCQAVCDVRVFGLLIGIELNSSRRPRRWFKKRLYQIYLSALLRHPRFPALVGFCQCEPNVLKITPPLTVQPEEIWQLCAAIGETLRRPLYRLLAGVAGSFVRPFRLWSNKHETFDSSSAAALDRRV
jgi:acetylornithine/succinyldiaminopimelate/putrescine aminotransferase